MEIIEGETPGSVGQGCPALQKLQGSETKNSGNGDNGHLVQASPWEVGAVDQLLAMHGAASPHGPSEKSPAQRFREAGFKMAGALFLFVPLVCGAACGLGHHFSPVAHQTGHNTAVPIHATVKKTQAGKKGANSGEESEVRSQESEEGQLAVGGQQKPEDGKFSAALLEAYRAQRDLLNDLIRGFEKLLGMAASPATGAPAVGRPEPTPIKIVHTIGRLEYRDGFKEVWVDDILFDLRGRIMVRLLLEYLVVNKVFDAASAVHFADVIDPYVRELSGVGKRGKFSETKIQDYFREPSGQLIKLCQALIRPGHNKGEYYLAT